MNKNIRVIHAGMEQPEIFVSIGNFLGRPAIFIEPITQNLTKEQLNGEKIYPKDDSLLEDDTIVIQFHGPSQNLQKMIETINKDLSCFMKRN